jgi:hypothetical protein
VEERKKCEFAFLFFRAQGFRFFSAFFLCAQCAVFWLRARESESAKKVPAPISKEDTPKWQWEKWLTEGLKILAFIYFNIFSNAVFRNYLGWGRRGGGRVSCARD